MKKLLFTAALVLSVGAFAQKNITKTVGVPLKSATLIALSK
nr:hypothetical protein [Elizabethkingia bruuniana]